METYTFRYYRYTVMLLSTAVFSIGNLSPAQAQKEKITSTVSRAESESHLRFLAADELRGRNTGTIELDITARYIAEQFRKYGLKPVDENGNFLQEVPMLLFYKPQQVEVELLDQTFVLGKDLIWRGGSHALVEAPIVLLLSDEDLVRSDIMGKIVVFPFSLSGGQRQDRRKLVNDKGGVGVVELFLKENQLSWPWGNMREVFNRDKMDLEFKSPQYEMPYVFISDTLNSTFGQLKQERNRSLKISISGNGQKTFNTFNVTGMVEGTDEILKREYIVLTAHYDHLGVFNSPISTDSIYNGTRDNAVGTAALLNAAQYFHQYPPKRSILFIALTAEEKGLLGSEYYVYNPLVPLHQCMFNLNIDNAGYNDIRTITMFGSDRTNIEDQIKSAAEAFGLKAMEDPFPDRNFIETSDQISFMKKGIPAMQYGMGYSGWDEHITNYYHKPSDEVESLNLDYIYTYQCSYILAAEMIANWDQRPYWTAGDEFEEVAEELYQGKRE